MTIGHLWLPSLGTAPTGPPTLVASNTFNTASATSPTISFGGYTLKAGDFIVFAVAYASNTAPGLGGNGATWNNINDGTTPGYWLCYGYNASAGGASFSFTYPTGSADLVFAVFSNVSTSGGATAHVADQGAPFTNSVTSSALGYSVGQLLVNGFFNNHSGDTFATTTWSNGQTTNNIGSSNTHFDVNLDYIVANTGSSLTITSGVTAHGGVPTANAGAFNHA